MNIDQQKYQKITVQVPQELLKHAQEASGQGITETVRLSLEMFEHKYAYQKLKSLRGSHKFSVNIEELREDR